MLGMMNGDRHGGFKDERGCVLLNEGEEKKKIFFLADGLARPCHHRHGPCQPSGKMDVVGLVCGQRLQKNFALSHHIWTNTY